MAEPNETLKVSKTDAAKRQLEAAIRLWFYDGDPVSIHTLAAAAHQVVHDLGRARGITAKLRELPNVRPEFKKRMHDALARAENFFKHADHDPDALLQFKPITTSYFLIDAVLTYELLTGESSPVMRTFRMWIMIQYPELVKADIRDAWLTNLKQARPMFTSMAKQEFFTTYQHVIALHQSS
jgi:hypothetical protein